jgi:hypothetical protein
MIDLFQLKGRKISVLLDELKVSGRRESYVGRVIDVDDKFLMLNCQLDVEFHIDQLIVRRDMILSIWVFKE